MNKKILKSLVSIFVATLMLTSSFAVFAADGIISPWNTTYDFNGNNQGNFSEPRTGPYVPSSDAWSIWISTYTKLAAMKDTTWSILDHSKTDSEGTPIPDGVTGLAGDKYFAIDAKKQVVTKDENGKESVSDVLYSGKNLPGCAYFNALESNGNSYSNVNGGMIYDKAVFECDIRVDEITATAYNNDGGKIEIYAKGSDYKRITAISIPIYHSNSGLSWYTSYTNAQGTKSPSVNAGVWMHVKINVDVKKGTYTFSIYPVDKQNYKPNTGVGSGFTSNECNIKESAKNLPLATTMVITAPRAARTSIDNMSVTKETFVVDETKTAIAADGTNVNASVTIGNCVYADANTQFGDTIKTTSPVAILALYNKADGSLIDVDFDTVTYENHNPSGDTDKDTYFKAAPDYQTVSLSLAQPRVEYEAKVYVWDSMSGMVPYVETYPTVAAE